MPTLSVVTTVSDVNSKQFYLSELVASVYEIADEIIIVDGDKGADTKNRETMNMIHKLKKVYTNPETGENKIWAYYNPWESRMGVAMYGLQDSLAISHASKEWILHLDGDEVIHEDDHIKIKKAMVMGDAENIDVFSLRTLHFYRDYNHIKTGANKNDPGNNWYNHKPRLFKNNKGIYSSHIEGHSGLVLSDNRNAEEIAKKTSIVVYHYGHTRSLQVYINKTNQIEHAFHGENAKIISKKDFRWDMEMTEKFEGKHPKAMQKRISKFNRLFGENGDCNYEK